MRPKKIAKATPEIIAYFNALPQKVFTPAQMNRILLENREAWGAAKSMGVSGFIDFLIESLSFGGERFDFPSRSLVRYWQGEVGSTEVDDVELVQSLSPQGYLSHRSAMKIHNLIEQDSIAHYVNEEQPAKSPGNGNLAQSRIDAAYSRPPRESNRKPVGDDYEIYILNGMNTGELGVIQYERPGHIPARVTNIERTLIDIAVRPCYAGSVQDILAAYRLAAGRVSIESVAAMLKQLNYTYPYYQSIGFILDKSGHYSEEDVRIFREMAQEFDFYLTYQMEHPAYSKEWRLYYPADIDDSR